MREGGCLRAPREAVRADRDGAHGRDRDLARPRRDLTGPALERLRRSHRARAPRRAGALGLIALLALLTLASASAAATWSAQDFNVPPTAFGSLEAVSCTGPNDCTAVGSATGDTSAAGITEHWDGTSWSMRALPDAAGKDLTGISCSASVACMAVGSSAGAPLAERWDGVRWSATPTSDSGSGSLKGVSCTADGHCLAVGQGPAGAALAEVWDGTSWASASPTGTATEFDGVSRTSAEDCTAIGAAGRSALAEHWNGSGWTLEPTVDEPGADSSLLESVACTSGLGLHCRRARRIPLHAARHAALRRARRALGRIHVDPPEHPESRSLGRSDSGLVPGERVVHVRRLFRR
jgi:hypothetical protein